MNVGEIARVLAKAQAYDRRTIGEADVLAWHEALSDVDVADALAAVAAHYRDSTDWLMPAHIRRRTDVMQRERRADELHALALESADADRRRFTADDVRRGAATIAALREKLPPGEPAKLRGEHWLATRAVGQLRDGTRPVKAPTAPAVPNPYYDPAAARALVEMNAAELPAATDDAPERRPEP